MAASALYMRLVGLVLWSVFCELSFEYLSEAASFIRCRLKQWLTASLRGFKVRFHLLPHRQSNILHSVIPQLKGHFVDFGPLKITFRMCGHVKTASRCVLEIKKLGIANSWTRHRFTGARTRYSEHRSAGPFLPLQFRSDTARLAQGAIPPDILCRYSNKSWMGKTCSSQRHDKAYRQPLPPSLQPSSQPASRSLSLLRYCSVFLGFFLT